MPTRWLLFVAVACALAAAQQQPQPPAPSSATVTAVTQVPLDAKSCVNEKEFRSSITSPFVFNRESIQEGAEFVGHIQACNHDLDSGKLVVAAVVIDSVALPKGRSLPIFAFLQALGPPLPPSKVRVDGPAEAWEKFDSTFRQVMAPTNAAKFSDVSRALTDGPTDVGVLSNLSTGVLGLKHIEFDNTGTGKSLLWVFYSDSDSLELKPDSQLVVRFSIAPPAAQVANKQ